ncbi:MAG: hypothetical protein HY746_09100 [Elusimicrobia bacterium]|nr:hypothetical protein [Elusimicrobiota bacterium]
MNHDYKAYLSFIHNPRSSIDGPCFWRSSCGTITTRDTSYRNQDWAKDNRMNFYLGGESWFKYHTFGLRSGLNFTQSDMNELTLGLSYNKPLGMASLLIDYSVAWPMNIKDNLGTHRISIGARF